MACHRLAYFHPVDCSGFPGSSWTHIMDLGANWPRTVTRWRSRRGESSDDKQELKSTSGSQVPKGGGARRRRAGRAAAPDLAHTLPPLDRGCTPPWCTSVRRLCLRSWASRTLSLTPVGESQWPALHDRRSRVREPAGPTLPSTLSINPEGHSIVAPAASGAASSQSATVARFDLGHYKQTGLRSATYTVNS